MMLQSRIEKLEQARRRVQDQRRKVLACTMVASLGTEI
jgi:hypothetical protein